MKAPAAPGDQTRSPAGGGWLGLLAVVVGVEGGEDRLQVRVLAIEDGVIPGGGIGAVEVERHDHRDVTVDGERLLVGQREVGGAVAVVDVVGGEVAVGGLVGALALVVVAAVEQHSHVHAAGGGRGERVLIAGSSSSYIVKVTLCRAPAISARNGALPACGSVISSRSLADVAGRAIGVP